ncbi:MAG TPA: hypothetical protein GXZ87_05940 [Bacteroidales bacterium]|nr:hypothetical protein [Bacteroidales bacterium]
MRTFLKIISYVFQPLLMPTFGMILLMQIPLFQLFPSLYRLIAITGTFLFTGIFPAIPIFMMMSRGQVKDMFISRREERTIPYLFSFLAYVFWVLFLWRTLQFPMEFVIIGIGVVVALICMVFINLKWKISAHAAGMGGLVGCILTVSYFVSINPLGIIILSLLISGLVAISRIYLKAHTLMQVLGGFCLGVSCVILSAFIYTLIAY